MSIPPSARLPGCVISVSLGIPIVAARLEPVKSANPPVNPEMNQILDLRQMLASGSHASICRRFLSNQP